MFALSESSDQICIMTHEFSEGIHEVPCFNDTYSWIVSYNFISIFYTFYKNVLLKDVFISVENVFRNLLNRFIIYSSMHMIKCYSHLKRVLWYSISNSLEFCHWSQISKNFFFLHFTVSMKDIVWFNQFFIIFFKQCFVMFLFFLKFKQHLKRCRIENVLYKAFTMLHQITHTQKIL